MPATITGTTPSIPLLSPARLDSFSQEDPGVNFQGTGTGSAKENRQNSADTVNISMQSRQTMIADIKTEDKKKEESNPVNSVEKSGEAVSKVLFVYDLKGDLSTKFMDSSNRVVYQVPSELMLRMKEVLSKSNPSVDTKA